MEVKTILGVSFDEAFCGSREVPAKLSLDEAIAYLDAEFSMQFDEYHVIGGEYLEGDYNRRGE